MAPSVASRGVSRKMKLLMAGISAIYVRVICMGSDAAGAQGVVVVPAGFAVQFDGLHPAGQHGDEGAGLESGDVLTDALVDPHSEADVAGRVAGQIEGVGLGPAARIAVRRPQKHQDLLAVRHGHSPTQARVAVRKNVWTVSPAEGLIECDTGQRGVGAKSVPLIRICGKGVQKRRNSEDGGIDTRRQE